MTTMTSPGMTVLVATGRPVAPGLADSIRATLVVELEIDRVLGRAKTVQPDVIVIDAALVEINCGEFIAALKTVAPAAELIITHSVDTRLEQILTPRRRLPRRAALAALADVFEHMGLSQAEVRDVANAFCGAARLTLQPSVEDREIAERIAGPAPGPGARARLELEGLERYFGARRQVLEGSLSTEQVASLLGTSRQTPHDRVRARTLLAVQDGGRLRFPPWQFDPEADDGVVGGLPQVLRAMRVSPLAAARWLTRGNPVLEGRAPLEALRAGEVRRVVAEAAGLGPD